MLHCLGYIGMPDVPLVQDASGRNVRVIATAAHVCRDTAAIDIYVGTDLRVPGPQTVMEDSCCAPVLASWIAHTDAPKGALQVGGCLAFHMSQGLQILVTELAASERIHHSESKIGCMVQPVRHVLRLPTTTSAMW